MKVILWLFHFLGPYNGERKLVVCSCGRVMWLDAKQEIKALHLGHRMHMCSNASFWSFLKLKLGLLDHLTLQERITISLKKAGLA